MSEYLIRQRRNLLALSSFLIVFNFADVSIAKVSLLGTELLIGDPAKLKIFIWTIWSYFLLRYYQYWKDEPDTGLIKTFKNRFEIYGKKFRQRDHIQDRLGSTAQYNLNRKGLFTWHYSAMILNPALGQYEAKDDIQIPFIKIYIWYLKSFLYVCIKTPRVSEYVFPFILAAIAPASTLIKIIW